MDSLTLVSNPGSASRKYALYSDDGACLLKIHFEVAGKNFVYSWQGGRDSAQDIPAEINHLAFAASQLPQIINKILGSTPRVEFIALRIVAPSSHFQSDAVLDHTAMKKLADLEPRANLHINASLQEAHLLQRAFTGAKILGISDSTFYKDMPALTRHYGLPLKDAAANDIYRFGYHGLAAESVVSKLQKADKLPKRLVICHLGSGSSVTAVLKGNAWDCSMGYSPLEGLVMATRSGSIDITAVQSLQKNLGLNQQEMLDYLNHDSGLLGISGKSSDIRQLLELESKDDANASLALEMYVYHLQQSIGAMASGLGGIDGLVFTGTIGQRSAEIRKRAISKLLFLGLGLDPHANQAGLADKQLAIISPVHHPAKIYVVEADEEAIMSERARTLG